MKCLEDLLKRIGKGVVRRNLRCRNEELIANVNMRLYLAGKDSIIPVKENTQLDRVAIEYTDKLYGFIERILPKKYLDYGRESLNEPAFPNSNYK